MYFLYILLMMHKKTFLNAFYSVALELALVLAVSGAGFTLPQLLPACFRVYPRQAVLLAPVCQIMQGGGASAGS